MAIDALLVSALSPSSAKRLCVCLYKTIALSSRASQGNLAGQQKVVVVDPIRDSVESALRHRESEYLSQTSCAIFCGTFNVNGKSPGQESYLPWLFPEPGEHNVGQKQDNIT